MSSLVNFDPKLKYEIIGYLTNGSFGTSSLVQIRSSTSYMFAMKRVDLLDTQISQQSRRQTLPQSVSQSRASNTRLSRASYVDSSERERLNRALKKLKLSQHENLLYFIEIFMAKDSRSVYLVSEFCKEDSLKTRLTVHKLLKTSISNDLIFKWFSDTISALNYLHQREILHANVKPSNFLLSSGDRIKLSDFGYLTILSEKAQKLYLAKLTTENINYIPPETLERLDYSDLSDVFAVACVFHEILFLEPYTSPKEDLRTDLKLRCGNEHFADTLISMLLRQSTHRPNVDSLYKFTQFHSDIRDQNTQIINKGLFKITFLINDFKNSSKKLILKQIQLADRNMNTIRTILQNLTKLSQNNLMPIHDYTFINKRLYISTEYQTSGNLTNRIEAQRAKGLKFPENLILQWLLQMSNGLQFLHRNSIIHGNLKCENVLFSKGNLIKLSDFGFHHLLVYDNNSAIQNFSTVYSPPEIIFSKGDLFKYTIKSDIFSFGSILCKCLTYKRYYDLFYGDNDDEIETKSLHTTLSSENTLELRVNSSIARNQDYKIKALGTDYTYNLRLNITQMLHEKPYERPSLEDLVSNLRNLVSVNYSKLSTTQPICSELKGKIKIFMSRNLTESTSDFIIVAKTTSLEPKKVLDSSIDRIYSCYQLKLDNMGCNHKLIKTELTKIIPKLICLLNDNYLIGIDYEAITLYEEKLKKIKSIELKDLLWSHLELNSNEAKTAINYKSIYYDSRLQRLFLLLTLKQSTTQLIIFDLIFSIVTNKIHQSKREEELEFLNNIKKNKNQVECEQLVRKYLQNLTNNKSKEKEIKSISFSLSLHAIHNLAINPLGSKALFTSNNYLFICEREKMVRVFNKENGRYIFCIQAHSNTQNDSLLNLNNSYPIDICGDSNGNLYIAYSTSIEVYNNRGEFIWKHELPIHMGVITRISINKIGSLAFTTSYTRENLFKNRLFIYP